MEELFVYTLLYVIGYDKIDEYYNTLDRLFLDEPTNENLLDLEVMKWKDAMLHLLHLMKSEPINNDKFGAFLMRSLKPVYLESDIFDFDRKMYKIWNLLPYHTNKEQPFFTFCYAGDYLSYGDEKQCRILYEKALNYYEKN